MYLLSFNALIILPAVFMVLAGMGSNVCSRNSKMCGLIMVSSGTLCRVIHANSEAFFIPCFLQAVYVLLM